MNTFRNKQFKNELDPKYAFYDCLRSCELKSSSEKTLEEFPELSEVEPYTTPTVNITQLRLEDQVELRNEELNDQTEIISCNAIILDLPDPQQLVKWAEKSLVLGGKLLCYVPTINQVENLLSSLDGWSEIEINEMMHRTWQSRLEAIRPNTNILGHTGFIVSARLLNK